MLENHVTSLELSKRLKELGVKQESLFYWVDKNGWALQDRKPSYCNIETCECVEISYLSAFLASELGELIPYEYIVSKVRGEGWFCYKYDGRYNFSMTNIFGITIKDKNEADARAEMLIHLLENNLTTL